MKNVYIFHDSFSDPNSDWYPWLIKNLQEKGYEAPPLSFPTPAGESLASWEVALSQHHPEFTSETYLVGHGTGALFALRLLEKMPTRIHGTILVAGYSEPLGNKALDTLQETFLEKAFDWNLIKKASEQIYLVVGDDDPFVSQEKIDRLATSLGIKPIVLAGGGHITTAFGFHECQPILDIILQTPHQLDASLEITSRSNDETQDNDMVLLDEKAQDSSPLVTQPLDLTREHNEPTPTSDSLSLKTPKTSPDDRHARHTWYDDMSRIMESKQGAVTSSLLNQARTEEKMKREKSFSTPKNIAYLVGIIFSVIGMIALGYVMFQKQQPSVPLKTSVTILSLIPADEHHEISLDTETPFFIIQKKIEDLVTSFTRENIIYDIYYTSQAQRISFGFLMKLIPSTSIPQGLFAEFSEPTAGPAFMHGVATIDGQTSHFLVIRFEHYDIMVNLMKEWEPTLVRDMQTFFPNTRPLLTILNKNDLFSDEIIDNRNVRVLRYHEKNKQGTLSDTPSQPQVTITSHALEEGSLIPSQEIISSYKENDLIVSYFFLDEKTLIISDRSETIPAIIKRWAHRQIY